VAPSHPDLEHLAPRWPKACKHRRIGAGHEGLAVERFDQIKQRRPAAFVKMGGNFVEQKDRRMAGHGPHQLRMPQNDPDQQRLLLPGRGQRRGHRLGAVMHDQIGSVRTRQVSVRPRHRAACRFHHLR
jgi:hypothetical protein